MENYKKLGIGKVKSWLFNILISDMQGGRYYY